MTKVMLHGLLGKKFGEQHEFFIRKPSDALKALMANKKGFTKAFRTWGAEGKYYQIICDGEAVNSELSLHKYKQYKTIDIVPAIVGSSDELKTGVGIILMVVAYAFPGWWSPFLKVIGGSLITMGIMGLLYPPPTPSFESTPQAKSFLFSSTQNATVQGVPVPVGYGRLRVGSKIISTSIRPERLSKARSWGGIPSRLGPTEPSNVPHLSNLATNDMLQGFYTHGMWDYNSVLYAMLRMEEKQKSG